MKPKTKFMKWYYKFPKKDRRNLVWKPYGDNPMSLNVIWMEIYKNTKLGDKLLEELGFEEE